MSEKPIEVKCVYCGRAQPSDIVIEIDEDGVVYHPTLIRVGGRLVLKREPETSERMTPTR